MAGIDVYRQIEEQRGGVEQGGLFQEGARAPAAVEDEKAGGHEEKGDSHTGYLPCEDEIRRLTVGGERGGVYRHHQKAAAMRKRSTPL